MRRFESRSPDDDVCFIFALGGVPCYAGRKNLLRKGSFLPAPFFFQTFSIDDPGLYKGLVQGWGVFESEGKTGRKRKRPGILRALRSYWYSDQISCPTVQRTNFLTTSFGASFARQVLSSWIQGCCIRQTSEYHLLIFPQRIFSIILAGLPCS